MPAAPEIARSEQPASEAQRADARRNRETVIEAAMRALAVNPNASMADIAAAAGLGRTTVYRHFETREELITALFGRVVVEAREATETAIAESDGAAETLRALGPALIEIGERFRFLHAYLAFAAEAFAEGMRVEDDPVRLFLTRCHEAGELREDVPVTWMQALMQSSAIATMDEIRYGHLDRETAGRLLGETFVSVFLPN